MSDLLRQATDAHHLAARLAQEHARAVQTLRQTEQVVMEQICPFHTQPYPKRFIPLDTDRALISPSLSLEFPEDPTQPPFWKAHGQEVVFRLGGPQKTRQLALTQAEFEALPLSVRQLTAHEMTQVTEAPIGLDKPLKLSERQMSMFLLLSRMDHAGQQPFQHRENGQSLPHAQWDSHSATVDIWRGLLRRGVLTLVSGQAFAEWKVNPGPRFEEAIDLALNTPGVLTEGSFARQAVLEAFRSTLTPRTAPKP